MNKYLTYFDENGQEKVFDGKIPRYEKVETKKIIDSYFTYEYVKIGKFVQIEIFNNKSVSFFAWESKNLLNLNEKLRPEISTELAIFNKLGYTQTATLNKDGSIISLNWSANQFDFASEELRFSAFYIAN